jgi:beta-fructofuranosidase
VFGPETLVDDRGRRIFMATIADARDYQQTGWQNIMTLPWRFTPADGGRLKIDPVEELRTLRYDQREVRDQTLGAGDEVAVEQLSSVSMEAVMNITTRGATRFGLKLFCSPDSQEQTVITYNAERQEFVVDYERSSTNQTLKYRGYTSPHAGRENKARPELASPERNFQKKQTVPCRLNGARSLRLDLFVDRSVVELFVNSDLCIVQRVYPVRDDSRQFRFFSVDGQVVVSQIVKWEMDATNPW